MLRGIAQKTSRCGGPRANQTRIEAVPPCSIQGEMNPGGGCAWPAGSGVGLYVGVGAGNGFGCAVTAEGGGWNAITEKICPPDDQDWPWLGCGFRRWSQTKCGCGTVEAESKLVCRRPENLYGKPSADCWGRGTGKNRASRYRRPWIFRISIAEGFHGLVCFRVCRGCNDPVASSWLMAFV